VSTVLRVLRAGHVTLQDLGRHGYMQLGVPAGGASDQHAARTANALAGNADDAVLLEVTGSELSLVTDGDILLAVTGAANHVLVDGVAFPTWELLAVPAGAHIVLLAPTEGLRSYAAVNGGFVGQMTLGSVAPDPLLGISGRIEPGDELFLTGELTHPPGIQHRLFRLGAVRPEYAADGTTTVDVTPGPDLARFAPGSRLDIAPFTVTPQSDHVGLRLDGPALALRDHHEILSRGVPVGAVELPPSGGVIVLMRGRLVTAGYPVVAVATTTALDRLAQLRPGDALTLRLTTIEAAVGALRAQRQAHVELGARVRNALTARGLGRLIHAVRAPA
jgi:5-oxoprolinase (ATP-hydrolysing) subunit C